MVFRSTVGSLPAKELIFSLDPLRNRTQLCHSVCVGILFVNILLYIILTGKYLVRELKQYIFCVDLLSTMSFVCSLYGAAY
jgi:hypothetical protein